MQQFIAFHISDDDGGVPVATGSSREEALGLAAQRVLSKCILYGGIAVQQRDDLDVETFQKLTDVLNKHFAQEVAA